VKSIVLGDEPSAFGHGPVPNANGPATTVVDVGELDAESELAATDCFLSPPRDRKTTAAMIATTIRP